MCEGFKKVRLSLFMRVVTFVVFVNLILMMEI